MKLFENKPDEDVRKFWQGMEETLGTPILAYTLGQYLSGRDVKGPMWGLLYLTRDTLYFQHFAQRNWFASVMQSSGAIPGSENFTIEVALGPSLGLEQDNAGGWRRFLRGNAADTCRLVDRSGVADPFVFSIEQRDSSLLRELRRLLG
ncbi:MAG: hypothetical protein EA427_04505 [Spirochaetaceae bacterium]|nr:MAG: hypothetical protein EA427_04505 [Spirochaetaceae bacterium]